MSRIKNISLGLFLLFSSAQAQTVWLDDRLQNVPKDKASFYMKEPPVEHQGFWSAEVYGKNNNKLCMVADLRDPDISKQQFVDNKLTFYCSSGHRQERIIKDKNTIEVWEYFQRSGDLFRHFFLVDGQMDGRVEVFNGASYPMRLEEYKHGKKHGVERIQLEDGRVLSEKSYTDDLLDGMSQEWNEKGQLLKQMSYKKGRLDGPTRRWNANGQLIVEEQYQNGVSHGRQMEWDRQGRPLRLVHYVSGKLQGEYIRFSTETGQMLEKQNFDQNQLVGLSEYYAERPSRYLQRTQRYDKQHRLVEEIYYNVDKTLNWQKTVAYQKDWETTTQTVYRDDGQIAEKKTIKKNVRNKLVETTTEQLYGKNKYGRKETQLNGLLHGTVAETYVDGGKSTLTYKNGVLDGPAFSIDAKGQILEKGSYKAGKFVGPWQKVGFIQGEEQNTAIQMNYNQKGEPHGRYLEKNSHGEVLVSGQYQNGKKIGEWKETYSGNKVTLSYDKSSKLHGRYIVTDKAGQLVEEMQYQHGKKVGPYKRWDNGKVVVQGVYENNEKQGFWLDDGNSYDAFMPTICKGTYDQGRKIGKWQCFSALGYLTSSLYYDDKGLRQGNGYFFNSNGMLEEIAHFKDDVPDGPDKTFDEKGRETVIIYKMGKVVE